MTIENIPDEILEELREFSELTETEKEKIYEIAYDETTIKKEELQRGLWAKFLIEHDGDEKKTQTSYIKKRVEDISVKLQNSKFESSKESYLEQIEIEKEKEFQDKVRDYKELINQQFAFREHYEKFEASQAHSKIVKTFGILRFRITIFKFQYTHMYPFYWIVNRDENNVNVKRHFGDLEAVEKDIKKHFENLLKQNPELEEFNNNNNEDNQISIEEVLDFGQKLKRNKTLLHEIKEIIEWSKVLNNPEKKEAAKFLEAKKEEHLNILLEDPFEGRERFEKENLIKAKQMIKEVTHADGKKNLEWFKAVIWEAQLFADANPVDNDLSELISNWIKINS